MPSRSMFLVVTLLACGTVACGGPEAKTPDAIQFANTNEHLEMTSWRLSSYVPETDLAPQLQDLLTTQYASLTVRFEKGRIVAVSAGKFASWAWYPMWSSTKS